MSRRVKSSKQLLQAPGTGRGSVLSRADDFLGAVDRRTLTARRWRSVVAAHISDLGGEDNCSEAEKSIVRRAASITVVLETMEADLANTGTMTRSDLDDFQRASNSLRRLLEAVGLSRRARLVTPPGGLAAYLEGHAVPVREHEGQ